MQWNDKLKSAHRAASQSWGLARPYFFHPQHRVPALGLLLVVGGLTLLASYWGSVLVEWFGALNDFLQSKDRTGFDAHLWKFLWVGGVLVGAIVYSSYLTDVLELRWRRWLTQRYLGRWLTGHTFYRLELLRSQPDHHAPDNPDQRIQEDVRQFVGLSLRLSVGLLGAFATLCVFGVMLARISDGADMHWPEFMGGGSIDIPGFMLWVALLYCGVGTWVTFRIGKPLKHLSFEVQRLEANFRSHMARVRDNAEAIALDRGHTVEQAQIAQRFQHLLDTSYTLIRKQRNLGWFTNCFNNASMVFPYVVLASRYFAGDISLGTLTVVSGAFASVQGSLSWLINNFSQLAEWSAATQRLADLDAALNAPDTSVDFTHQPGDAVVAQQLQVALPNGQVLLHGVQLQAQPGDAVLLSGASGCGKSSLLRALAGIWPFAQGAVQLPGNAMFMPQKPYFPEGRLRDALAYPHAADRYSDAQLRDALHAARLPLLVAGLDTSQAWHQVLSGGEQQRLAAARVLLQRPAWVLADEASSALDNDTEAHIYTQLTQLVQAQGGGLISIAHRDSVRRFHRTHWQVDKSTQQVRVQPLEDAKGAAAAAAPA